jgi:hypothetical protein
MEYGRDGKLNELDGWPRGNEDVEMLHKNLP